MATILDLLKETKKQDSSPVAPVVQPPDPLDAELERLAAQRKAYADQQAALDRELEQLAAQRNTVQYNNLRGWEKPAFVAGVAGGATQGAATPAAREAVPFSPAETRMVNPAYNADLDFMRNLESLKPFAVTQSQSAWQAEDAAAEQRLRDVASMEMRNYFENELGGSQFLGGAVNSANATIQALQGLVGQGVDKYDMAMRQALGAKMAQAEPGIWGSVKRGLGGMAADVPLMLVGGKLASSLGKAKTYLQTAMQVGAAVQPLALRGAINTWQESGKVSDTLADWTIETIIPALFGAKDAWGYFINGAGRAVKPGQLAAAILATGAWGGTDEGATEFAHILYEASTGKTDENWKSRLAAAALTGFIAESGIAGAHEISAVPRNIVAQEAQGKYVAGQERAAEQAGVLAQYRQDIANIAGNEAAKPAAKPTTPPVKPGPQAEQTVYDIGRISQEVKAEFEKRGMTLTPEHHARLVTQRLEEAQKQSYDAAGLGDAPMPKISVNEQQGNLASSLKSPEWTDGQISRVETILSDKSRFPGIAEAKRVGGDIVVKRVDGSTINVTVVTEAEMAKLGREHNLPKGQEAKGLYLQNVVTPDGVRDIVALLGGNIEPGTVSHEFGHNTVAAYLNQNGQLDTLARWARQAGIDLPEGKVGDIPFEEAMVEKVVRPGLSGQLPVPSRIQRILSSLGSFLQDTLKLGKVFGLVDALKAPAELVNQANDILARMRSGDLFKIRSQEATNVSDTFSVYGARREQARKATAAETRQRNAAVSEQQSKARQEAQPRKEALAAEKVALAERKLADAEAKRASSAEIARLRAEAQKAKLEAQTQPAIPVPSPVKPAPNKTTAAVLNSQNDGAGETYAKLPNNDQTLVEAATAAHEQDNAMLNRIGDMVEMLDDPELSSYHDGIRQALSDLAEQGGETKPGGVQGRFEVKTIQGRLPDEQAVVAALKNVAEEARAETARAEKIQRQADTLLDVMLGSIGRDALIDRIVSSKAKHPSLVDVTMIEYLKEKLRQDIVVLPEGTETQKYSHQLNQLNEVSIAVGSEQGFTLNYRKTLQEPKSTMEEKRKGLDALFRTPTPEIRKMSGPEKDTAIERLYQERFAAFKEELAKFGFTNADMFRIENGENGRFMTAMNMAAARALKMSNAERLTWIASTAVRSFLIGPRGAIGMAGANTLNASLQILARAGRDIIASKGVATPKVMLGITKAMYSMTWPLLYHVGRTAFTEHNSAHQHFTGKIREATTTVADALPTRSIVALESTPRWLRRLAESGFTYATMSDQFGQVPLGTYLETMGVKGEELYNELENVGAQRKFSNNTTLGAFFNATQRLITNGGALRNLTLGNIFPFFKGVVRSGEVTVRLLPMVSALVALYDANVAKGFKELMNDGKVGTEEYAYRRSKAQTQAVLAFMMSVAAPAILASLCDEDDLDDLAHGVIPAKWGFGENVSIAGLPLINALVTSEAYTASVFDSLRRGEWPSGRMWNTSADLIKTFSDEATGFARFGVALANFEATGDENKDREAVLKFVTNSTLGRILSAVVTPSELSTKTAAVADVFGGLRDTTLMLNNVIDAIGGTNVTQEVQGLINEARAQQGRQTKLNADELSYWLRTKGRSQTTKAYGTEVELSSADVVRRDREVRRWIGQATKSSSLVSDLNDYWEANKRLGRTPLQTETRLYLAKHRLGDALRRKAGGTLPSEAEARKLGASAEYNNYHRALKDITAMLSKAGLR